VAAGFTSRETHSIACAEEDPNGSLKASVNSSNSKSRSGMSTISCGMPRIRAVSAAAAFSSEGSPVARTVNARMLALVCRMAQHTSAESTPPESSTPMGTSETRRRRTASTSSRSVSSTASPKVTREASSISGGCQYRRWRISPPLHSRMVAAGSLSSPS
jgi:hypothetical protein